LRRLIFHSILLRKQAAEKNGKAADLQKELEDLFTRQNKSASSDRTSIPATYLRVTVAVN